MPLSPDALAALGLDAQPASAVDPGWVHGGGGGGGGVGGLVVRPCALPEGMRSTRGAIF